MEIKVIMDNHYVFTVTMDNEAMEWLHRLSALRKEKASNVVGRLLLGSIAFFKDLVETKVDKNIEDWPDLLLGEN